MTDLHIFLSKNCDKAQVAAAVTALTAAMQPTPPLHILGKWHRWRRHGWFGRWHANFAEMSASLMGGVDPTKIDMTNG